MKLSIWIGKKSLAMAIDEMLFLRAYFSFTQLFSVAVRLSYSVISLHTF